MTPHRTGQAAAWVVESAASAPAVLAALVGAFTSMHLLLAVVLVIVQGLDIWTGSVRAERIRGAEFDRRWQADGVTNKLMKDVQIVIAMAMDTAGLATGTVTVAVFTGGILAWLIYVESSSVLRNIRATEGPDAVWGGFRKADRRIDVQNFKRTHGPNEPVPARRHTDAAVEELNDVVDEKDKG